ncbi:S-layer homology domain-containing protein [bacterium]|nr:S-layer homology domain-containing protein [bacterium]
MPNNKFRPNDEVTRAEFVSAFSRMLYNTSDGEYRSTPKYYIHHMEKLK